MSNLVSPYGDVVHKHEALSQEYAVSTEYRKQSHSQSSTFSEFPYPAPNLNQNIPWRTLENTFNNPAVENSPHIQKNISDIDEGGEILTLL